MTDGKISVRLTKKNWVIVNNSIVGRYSMQHKYISLESAAKWVIGTTKHMIPCPDRDRVISTILKEIEECKPRIKPQKQTILSDPEKGILGNCLQACVASLLGLPIEEVPHFALRGEYWYSEFRKFLLSQGFKIEGMEGIFGKPDWYEKLKDSGFNGVDGYMIVAGDTNRKINGGHGVIYKDGKPFFDPHPSNDFLTKEWDVYLIEQIRPLNPSKCILPAGHEYESKDAYWEECKNCHTLKPYNP